MDWPDVNSLAFVGLVNEPVMLESRVQAVDGESVTLAAPIGGRGAPSLPSTGDAVLIAWYTVRGYYERKAVVESTRPAPQAEITLRAAGESRQLQRRAHVRVPQLSPVELVLNAVRIPASLLDISESGLRCVVQRPTLLGMDTVVSVTLELLDDASVDVTCRPARVYAADDDHLEIGLAFVGVDEVTTNRIRRHVFSQQVRDRAMGLL